MVSEAEFGTMDNRWSYACMLGMEGEDARRIVVDMTVSEEMWRQGVILQGYAILCSVTEMKDWRDAPVMKIPDVLSGAATQDRKEIEGLWAGMIKTQMNYKPGVDAAHRLDLTEHFKAISNPSAPYRSRPVVFKWMGDKWTDDEVLGNKDCHESHKRFLRAAGVLSIPAHYKRHPSWREVSPNHYEHPVQCSMPRKVYWEGDEDDRRILERAPYDKASLQEMLDDEARELEEEGEEEDVPVYRREVCSARVPPATTAPDEDEDYVPTYRHVASAAAALQSGRTKRELVRLLAVPSTEARIEAMVADESITVESLERMLAKEARDFANEAGIRRQMSERYGVTTDDVLVPRATQPPPYTDLAIRSGPANYRSAPGPARQTGFELPDPFADLDEEQLDDCMEELSQADGLKDLLSELKEGYNGCTKEQAVYWLDKKYNDETTYGYEVWCMLTKPSKRAKHGPLQTL